MLEQPSHQDQGQGTPPSAEGPTVPTDPGDTASQGFELRINPDLQGFTGMRVTEFDESLSYKPPKTVEVTLANGDRAEIDANTPYATLQDGQGNELSVSVAAAGHIHEHHIAGAEPGSQFDVELFDELLGIVAEHLPPEVAQEPGRTALSIETGRAMGSEGVASLGELLKKDLVSEEDIDPLARAQEDVTELNQKGSNDDKADYVGSYNKNHADSKIKLQLIRGTVIIPTVAAPKQPTTKLFMVFGPGKDSSKTMYTMAPGRYMPKMPNPAEHTGADGVVDQEAFGESAEAWLKTVILVN